MASAPAPATGGVTPSMEAHLDDQQQHYIRNYRRMQRGLPTATDILHLTRSVLVQQNVPPEPAQLGDFLRIPVHLQALRKAEKNA